VRVENTGKVAANEVVQVYTHQRAGSASRPVRELKAFSKVHLDAGESKLVRLDISASSLGYWSPSTRTGVLEPGPFDLWVGDSSEATLHADFTLAKP
jgi:beta-glucosidase